MTRQAASALVRGRDFEPRPPFAGIVKRRRGLMPGNAAPFLFLVPVPGSYPGRYAGRRCLKHDPEKCANASPIDHA